MKSENVGTIINISKMGLQNLQHEPQRLVSESERLNNELEMLVMDNYRIFVENLTCSVELRNEEKKLEEINEHLSEDLRSLSSVCSTFRDRVTDVINSHKRNRKTLQHHMQLVELLEIPQLVDACARNGFYDEALELANFVNGLERRHLLANEVKSTTDNKKIRNGSSVVQSIVDDVYNTLLSLRLQLLQNLTESSSLPRELHILGTLRKLDTIVIDRQLALERHERHEIENSSSGQHLKHMKDTPGMKDRDMKDRDMKDRDRLRRHLLDLAEKKLQMDFLEARSVWMERLHDRAAQAATSSQYLDYLSQLGDTRTGPSPGNAVLPSSGASSSASSGALGPYGKAMEMLESNRTAWFTIVTQFNALFFTHEDTSRWDQSKGEGNVEGNGILSAWMSKQVQRLLERLEALLLQIEEGGSLRSVMEQCFFFAERMGDVGCDFSSMLVSMFQRDLVQRLALHWRTACEQCKAILTTERMVVNTIEAEDCSSNSREQVVPLYIQNDSSSNNMNSISNVNVGNSNRKSFEEIVAPSCVLCYPPLAFLLNALLSGLNFLRECPMATARGALLYELELVLLDFVRYFIDIADEMETKSSKYFDNSNYKKQNKGKINNNTNNNNRNNNISGLSSIAEINNSNELIDDEKEKEKVSLTRRYASCMAHEVLPHVLRCFQGIFIFKSFSSSSGPTPTSAGSQGGQVSFQDIGAGVRIDKIYEARAQLGGGGSGGRGGGWECGVLEKVWVLLCGAGLLPVEVLAVSPPVAIPAPVVSSPTLTVEVEVVMDETAGDIIIQEGIDDTKSENTEIIKTSEGDMADDERKDLAIDANTDIDINEKEI